MSFVETLRAKIEANRVETEERERQELETWKGIRQGLQEWYKTAMKTIREKTTEKHMVEVIQNVGDRSINNINLPTEPCDFKITVQDLIRVIDLQSFFDYMAMVPDRSSEDAETIPDYMSLNPTGKFGSGFLFIDREERPSGEQIREALLEAGIEIPLLTGPFYVTPDACGP